MIENFLRRPSGGAEIAADAVRVLGLVSVLAGAVWWTPTDAGILAFTLPALVIPRFLAARAWFDAAFCITVLIAAWSNVLDLYTTVPGWDLVVHLVCTGFIAAMTYLTLGQTGVLERPGARGVRLRTALVMVTALALAVGSLWEMVEWAGYTFISNEIFVAYEDTIARHGGGRRRRDRRGFPGRVRASAAGAARLTPVGEFVEASGRFVWLRALNDRRVRGGSRPPSARSGESARSRRTRSDRSSTAARAG